MDAFIAPLPARRVDVTGADRVRYLEDVTSQHLVDVPVTHVRGALYLDVHGGPLAMFDVAVLGDRLVLLAPDEANATVLTDTLGMRTFLLDAAFSALDHEAIAVRGADADQVVRAAGLTAVVGRCRLAGDVLILARSEGVDVVGPAGAVADAREALLDAGARVGTAQDLEGWRIDAGIPGWGHEVVAPHLPEEVGLLPTHVHLAKGCYPGQEAVARMWMLGRPRRRLARVAVTRGSVAEGWTQGKGRHTVTITSVHPAGDRALAFVPGDSEPGARFGDDEAEVEVRALVGADAVPPGHDPAVVQRRDRPRA
ncbi:MAG: hypothetical protein JJT89_11685 [Nitriliruptoraceae bacterium]|nr:hypothetical protein [Nitriliruptoraceae bacterium]